MPHSDQSDLLSRLEQARVLVPIGSHWAHHSKPDVIYSIVDVGYFERDETPVVIYRNEEGLTWVRALDNFFSTVRRDDGERIPRFNRLP